MRIGIIGKSGSGKSTASGYLAEKYGYSLIDLDQIGRDVVNIYPEILSEITTVFGAQFVQNGQLDRPALGRLVFSDPAELERLNSIFFKYILAEVEKRTASTADCILEGVVLTELPGEKLYDRLIYIYADEDVSLQRLRQRENTPVEVLKQRIAGQSKYDRWLTEADYVIANNSDPDQMYAELAVIYTQS